MNTNKGKIVAACLAILLVFAVCAAVDGVKDNPVTGGVFSYGTV